MFDWNEDERWRFRGRMSGRGAPRHNSSNSSAASKPKYRHNPRAGGVFTEKGSAYEQRAVVQAQIRYADGRGGTGTARHLTYIQRDGAGRDGESPGLFGPSGEEVERSDFLERSRDDDHQFRIIVSPERGHDLDLEEYVDDWMEQIEEDLDQQLDWASAVHTNTDSPHAHVLVRGEDRDGDEVFMSPDYLNNGLRHRAQQVATYHLGPRTRSQMEQAHEKHAELDYFTELDGALLAAGDDSNQLHVDDIELDRPGLRHSHLRDRLHHLDKLGLARRDDGGRWTFHPHLSGELEELARQKDVLRRLREAGRDVSDEWSTGVPKDRLVGRVVDRGIADELEDRPYIVVDGEDGRTRYIEPDSDTAPSRGSFVELRDRDEGLDVEPIDDSDLERTIEAEGPTWLDRRLYTEIDYSGDSELGDAVHRATERRRQRLIERGLIEEKGRLPRDLVRRLRHYERQQYVRRLAEEDHRSVRQLSPDSRPITGELSDRKELRGGDVFVVRNSRELAVVPANKFLDDHANSRVRVTRSKNEEGRVRTFVEKAPERAPGR